MIDFMITTTSNNIITTNKLPEKITTPTLPKKNTRIFDTLYYIYCLYILYIILYILYLYYIYCLYEQLGSPTHINSKIR